MSRFIRSQSKIFKFQGHVASALMLAWISSCALAADAPAAPAAAALPSANVAARAGTVKSVVGQVFVERAGKLIEIKSGDGIEVNDKLVSKADSATSVVLRDGTVISLGAASSVGLPTYQFNATNQEGSVLMNLLGGSLRVVTGLIAKTNPAEFRVKTATSTIGVRGTDFIVEVPQLK